MALITFDTLEYSKKLEAKGFTVEQAEVLAMENKRVFNEFAENQLATKADLYTVKEELKTELVTVKDELKMDLNRLDKELAVVKWVAFATFGLVAAGFIKIFFA
ncbi:MAG: hypothetical protein ACP5D0_09815 [Hydrogenovibrio sp.]